MYICILYRGIFHRTRQRNSSRVFPLYLATRRESSCAVVIRLLRRAYKRIPLVVARQRGGAYDYAENESPPFPLPLTPTSLPPFYQLDSTPVTSPPTSLGFSSLPPSHPLSRKEGVSIMHRWLCTRRGKGRLLGRSKGLSIKFLERNATPAETRTQMINRRLRVTVTIYRN